MRLLVQGMREPYREPYHKTLFVVLDPIIDPIIEEETPSRRTKICPIPPELYGKPSYPSNIQFLVEYG